MKIRYWIAFTLYIIAFVSVLLWAGNTIYQSRPDRVSTAVPTLSNEKSCTGCPHGIEENIKHP